MFEVDDDATKVEPIFIEMKKHLTTGYQRTILNRKAALNALLTGYDAMKSQIDQALRHDLGYNKFMSQFAAHSCATNQIKHLLEGIDTWVKPVSVPTPIAVGMASSQIQPEPLGLVLVISAWNYPIYTALPQAAAAIAAGNSVIIKPSQLAPASSNVLKKLFDTHMDPSINICYIEYYHVVEGKIEVAKTITKLPFDMICFTGSTFTGRLVAIEAAKNLTPCLLELGGKCPTIVDETADLQSAAMRILFGKFLNCGQTCIGVDHVYVHESVKDRFKALLLQKCDQFYAGGQNLCQQGNYGKIINTFHFNRISNYLKQNHKGQIIYGGQFNAQKCYISPTIVQSPSRDSQLMKQQIFGPILPILYYTSLDNVIAQINSRPKPLVVYLFTQNKQHITKVQQQTSSGTFTVNDAIVQMMNPDLPFGGVGASGYGRFHGESGFIAFSNMKSILKTKAINSYPASQRFPPYTESKKNTMKKLLKYGGLTYQKIGRTLLLFGVLLAVVVSAIVLLPRL